MKIHFALPMILASIAFAVTGTSAGDMSRTTSMDQNADLPVNGSARIIGGKSTHIVAEFVCSLRRNDNHTCGCIILTKVFIITAAQCITSDPTPYSVVVGTLYLLSGGTTHMVKTVNIHPEYSYPNNDIAMLELKISIDYSKENAYNVEIPCLPEKPPHMGFAKVYGWGFTRDGANQMSNKMQKMVLKRLPSSFCRKLWKTQSITENMLCTMETNTGTCNGDAGGPLMMRTRRGQALYGIASFQSLNGCTTLPAVYTKVSAYVPWIQKVTGNSDCQTAT